MSRHAETKAPCWAILFMALAVSGAGCKDAMSPPSSSLSPDAGSTPEPAFRYAVWIDGLYSIATSWGQKPVKVVFARQKGPVLTREEAEQLAKGFVLVTHPEGQPVEVTVSSAEKPAVGGPGPNWKVTMTPLRELENRWYSVMQPRLPDGFRHSYNNYSEQFRRADGQLAFPFFVGSQPTVGSVILCPGENGRDVLEISLTEPVRAAGASQPDIPFSVGNADPSRGEPRCAQAYQPPVTRPEDDSLPAFNSAGAVGCQGLDSRGGIINVAIPIDGRVSRSGVQLDVLPFPSGARREGGEIRMAIPTDGLAVNPGPCRHYIPALMGFDTSVE